MATQKRVVAFGGVGTLTLVLAAFASLGAKNPEAPRVEAAVKAALVTIFDGATFKQATWTSGALPASDRAAMHARLDNELRAAFAGEARQRWGQSLHEAIDRDSDGQHVVVTAGGVSAFTVETEQILGDSAELTGRATSWITWIILDPGYPGPRAGHPSDEIAFQARLTRMDGQWQVVELSLERIGA